MHKRIIKLMLVILFVLSLSACSTKEDNPEKDNTDDTVINENDNTANGKFSNKIVEIDEDSKLGQMFDELSKYGKEIYNNKEYTKYEIRDNMYFASLNDLGALYDVSMFVGEDGTICNKNDSGIYFRDSYDKDELPYFPILIGCSKEELK